MPKDYHSEVTDNGTAEKWENNLNCCHIQNSGETGAIWQKTLTRQLDWAHVYDSLSSSCQEACDVKWPPTDSQSPPTDPLVPGNWMFPTGDIRAHFVLDLVDFLKHRETSNINHFWAHSRAELWTHTVIASPSFPPPGKSHCSLCPLLTSEARRCHVWNNQIIDSDSALQWIMTSAVWEIGSVSHFFLQRPC